MVPSEGPEEEGTAVGTMAGSFSPSSGPAEVGGDGHSSHSLTEPPALCRGALVGSPSALVSTLSPKITCQGT